MKIRQVIATLGWLWVTTTAHGLEIHDHITREIDPSTPVPKIEIQIYKDAMDGVNVHVDVENYELGAPDRVATKTDLNKDGILQGHAHVFINAVKYSRLYGMDMHIPASALKKGTNQIAVSLNSHNHENWTKNNHNIMSSVFFDLAKEPFILHNFSSQPLE